MAEQGSAPLEQFKDLLRSTARSAEVSLWQSVTLVNLHQSIKALRHFTTDGLMAKLDGQAGDTEQFKGPAQAHRRIGESFMHLRKVNWGVRIGKSFMHLS